MKVTRCEKSKLQYFLIFVYTVYVLNYFVCSRQYLKQKEEEDEERKRLESKYRDRV